MIRRCSSVILGLLIAAWVVFLGGVGLFLLSYVLNSQKSWGATDYSLAGQKAQEAFLVQSGIQRDINACGPALHGIAIRYIPANVFDPVLALGIMAKRKEISTGEFNSPVIPYAKHVFTISPGQGLLIVLWRF
jgi:hypothetical protein